MRRREFIAGLGSAAVWPVAAQAQQAARPVVGFLSAVSPEDNSEMAAFQQGLKEQGFVEHQNVTIEYRWARGQYDRLPALAAELVARNVAVIIATGASASVPAAKAATATIPIVFATGSDPVTEGLVGSLNRPGGNLTGVTFFSRALAAKRMELLRELVPALNTVAVLVNPSNPSAERDLDEIEAAARSLGLQVYILKASSGSELDNAFAHLISSRADAVFVNVDGFFLSRKEQIIALAMHYAIPTTYPRQEYTTAGGLLSYATSVTEAHRLVGVYTGRILKGEKPSDLPVQQPTKFELAINLKTAKALGLTVPPQLLARADEVIE
jgi:putative ABC transport system substrate-binding protein